VLRGDEFDIDYIELDPLGPVRIVVPTKLKTKTTKTP
jgi:hypothetical protein